MADTRVQSADPHLLQQAFELSVIGTVITDALRADYPIVYVNPAFESLTGYSTSEILGRNCRFLHGEDGDQPGLQEIRHALGQEQAVTVTLRNYRKNGTLFYNELTLSPLRDASGTVTHFVGYQNDVTGREEAIILAAQAHRHLRATLERITDGFVSYDRNLNFVHVNAAAARIAGKRPEDLIGHSLLTTLPELADSRIVHTILHAQETGTVQTVVGQRFGRWIDATAYPSEDGVSVINRDITERHQAEERLRSSEERLNTIFQACPIAIVVSRDSDRCYIDANPEFFHQSGYSREEVIGRTPFDLNIWADPQELEAVGRTLQDHGEVHNREVRFRLKSGMIADAVISVVPVMLGEDRCMVTLVRDITTDKHARKQLEASEERYRRLAAELQRTLDLSLDLITTINAKGHFVMVSAASEQILGYAPKELIGRSYLDFVHPDDRDKTTKEGTTIAGQHRRSGFQNRYLHRNGTVVWLEWAAVMLPGDPLMYCVVRDITVRQATEQQIQGLNQDLQKQLQHLTGIREIDQMIASSQDLPVTLDRILAHIDQQLGADAVSLLLLEPHTLNLEYAGTRGFTKPLKGATQKLGMGLAGEVALNRLPITVPDLQAVPLMPAWREVLDQQQLVAYYGVPLMAKGKVLGVIEVLHREPFQPSGTWLETVEMLAGQAAIAIDSAHLFRDLEQRNLQLRLAYDETIEGWARALDLRDKETEGHSRRVTETTVRLCQRLGLSSDELVETRRGALLHDIGKMGIPDAVLLKPGKLTDEQWMLMRQHPEYAVRLLSPIRFLRSALDIPQYHHEKWDGSGYPQGLSGTAIPLAVRAFTVVDVYDALTSDRPYREAWIRERALEHIQEGAGTHFDPHVVDAFLHMLKAE